MTDPKVLRELLELFRRPDTPRGVRASIAAELGGAVYEPAKGDLLAGLADLDANVRSSCIRALAIDWKMEEVGPLLVNVLLNDEFEFVRVDAAYGLGAIRYKQALPSLKKLILNERYDMTLREAAYGAVLSILGKEEDTVETDVNEPTTIDWNLVRNL